MTPEEKQQILGRLASSDVASLADLNISSYDTLEQLEAAMRLVNVLKVSPLDAENVLDKMVKTLQDSELTINFNGYDFFDGDTKERWLNAFEHGKNMGYMNLRDGIEENIFDYSNKRAQAVQKDVIDRIKNFGSYNYGNNVSFEASLRPKYAAINFARRTNGAAESFGKSYIVLKQYVKHNCTFTDIDSFGYRGDQRDVTTLLANYHHLNRLIVNMEEDMLIALHDIANGSFLVGKYEGYIEAQIHGNILFSRDVEKMYIDNFEISSRPDTAMLKKFYELFRKNNNVQLIFK
ncbi:DUF3626 domain-containing protein [Pedobacter hartonius]|uniref:Uncharacterized protein n=1 Tax=Pedobacter hartonius TaxID=425514 RepID=A0A1H4GBY0_9SPHI|nr:DUF3626 domain-containing protein [Pedobacter hartonius]SEB07054.1 Protein of unknown function [Pedobacter hartonius]